MPKSRKEQQGGESALTESHKEMSRLLEVGANRTLLRLRPTAGTSWSTGNSGEILYQSSPYEHDLHSPPSKIAGIERAVEKSSGSKELLRNRRGELEREILDSAN